MHIGSAGCGNWYELQSGPWREEPLEGGDLAGNRLRGAAFHRAVAPQNLANNATFGAVVTEEGAVRIGAVGPRRS